RRGRGPSARDSAIQVAQIRVKRRAAERAHPSIRKRAAQELSPEMGRIGRRRSVEGFRGRASLAAAAVTAAAFVALSGGQPVATVPKPARGGTAVEALVGQATVLNPLFESNESTRDANAVIYQGLTAVDSQQNVIGVLASGWTVSPDHLTYTVDLRTDVKWG